MKHSNASETPRVFRPKGVDELRQSCVAIKIEISFMLRTDTESVGTVESLQFLLLHSLLSLDSPRNDIRPAILDLPSS